ncbi:MAG: DUF4349 domain-containing protein [Deltaproteobacteria bacterium]|nr:DUF4349 domain-containing protein [Deltaproteobacteria bacterium]MDQ3297492.1 DUF4349 domain-containing protein [Myxococcota bacterium]
MRIRTRSARAARFATYALLTSAAFAACAKSDKSASAPAAVSTERAIGAVSQVANPATDAPDRLALQSPTDPNRKVIRTGRIDLVVAGYDDARAKLDALLAKAGGYVDSTQVQHYQGAVSSATLVLRIPSESFGALLPLLRQLGEISSESTNAEDVTDQYVDLAARLASAKTLEKRLLELAADRASGVEALLAVERELARVRGEIESYEGKLRQWNDQIAMSTLTLGISTRAPAIAAGPSPGLGSRIAEGFSTSVQALQDFGGWLAVTGIALLPWLVLAVPGIVFGRRWWRRHGKRLPSAVALPITPAPARPLAEPSI